MDAGWETVWLAIASGIIGTAVGSFLQWLLSHWQLYRANARTEAEHARYRQMLVGICASLLEQYLKAQKPVKPDDLEEQVLSVGLQASGYGKRAVDVIINAIMSPPGSAVASRERSIRLSIDEDTILSGSSYGQREMLLRSALRKLRTVRKSARQSKLAPRQHLRQLSPR